MFGQATLRSHFVKIDLLLDHKMDMYVLIMILSFSLFMKTENNGRSL